MASLSDFVVKHGVAAGAAIAATVAVSWYLETLSPAGVALVFLLMLGICSGLAFIVRFMASRRDGEPEAND